MNNCSNCPYPHSPCISTSMTECKVTTDQLIKQINDALCNLYTNDYYLIEKEVNEVCISTHFWYYFKSMFLRKNLCKNNQPQKNDFVVRASDRSLSFLFQYKLNTAVCQATDAKYPDATERSAVRSGYFAAHQFSLSGYIISSSPSTLPQSRSGIVHFLDISVVARYSALSSAVSLGNTLLCLFRRR